MPGVYPRVSGGKRVDLSHDGDHARLGRLWAPDEPVLARWTGCRRSPYLSKVHGLFSWYMV